MTHEYKHKVKLHTYDHCSKCDGYMSSYVECCNCGHFADVDSLLDYTRELEERNKQLEERIEKMRTAGDVLVQIAGIIGLCWSTTSFPTIGHIQEAVDNWRNA